jgi:hypothetical protein
MYVAIDNLSLVLAVYSGTTIGNLANYVGAAINVSHAKMLQRTAAGAFLTVQMSRWDPSY